MFSVKYLVMVAALICAAPCCFADDIVDDLENELNEIERSYWSAMSRRQDDPYYMAMRINLNEAENNARLIQQKLMRAGISSKVVVNPSVSLIKLRNLFCDAKPSQIRKYKFSLKPTSFKEYSRTKLRSKEKKSIREADYDDYAEWLDEITAVNSGRVRRSDSSVSSRDEKDMRMRLADYCEEMRQLRLFIIQLRQRTSIKFEPDK